jgi:hypothetical protein
MEVITNDGCDPVHSTDGTWAVGTTVTLQASNLNAISTALFALSFTPANPVDPFAGFPVGFLGLGPTLLIPNFNVGGGLFIGSGAPGSGTASLGPIGPVPAGLSGMAAYTQVFPLEVGYFSSTNAQRHILP